MFSRIFPATIHHVGRRPLIFQQQSLQLLLPQLQQKAPPLLVLPGQPGNSREVHSKRQIKRLFKGPRSQRILKRKGLDAQREFAPPPIEFPPVFEPKILRNGWSAPPPDDFVRPDYPFSVKRTGNKPHNTAGFLPVYTKYRKDGTKVTTLVKKITGDHDRFLQELRSVLGIPTYLNPNDDVIRIRAGGTIEVKGNHVLEVKTWLAGLGF